MSLPWKQIDPFKEVAEMSSRGRDVTICVRQVRRNGLNEFRWRIETEDRPTYVAVGSASSPMEARRRAEADFLLFQMSIL